MIHKTVLFESGVGDYACYRIPALIASLRGTVLAFCEGRRDSCSDTGQIDLLLRRSRDGGQTFAPAQPIFSQASWVCGNPAPVLDEVTGVIWLVFTKNAAENTESMIERGLGARTVWVSSSSDDGATWTAAREITGAVSQPDWTWYATGPGHGIQLRRGPAPGRLLIPCDHKTREQDGIPVGYYSHVIYSDDHGASWQRGGGASDGTNECCAVETLDGRVYLNSRNAPESLARRGLPGEGQPYQRVISWSADGGQHFTPAVFDPALHEPVCQASLCRLPDRVIFANPASARREKLTVRASRDACQSWPAARVLHPGPAAYSDLCVLPDETVLCLYECGADWPYQTLTLARFDLAWLEET